MDCDGVAPGMLGIGRGTSNPIQTRFAELGEFGGRVLAPGRPGDTPPCPPVSRKGCAFSSRFWAISIFQTRQTPNRL